MSRHTPGPWAYTTAPEGWCFNVHQADDADTNHPHSCDVAFMTVSCDPKAVQEANARLIAAAPELLDALKHCESMLMSYSIDRVDHEQIEDKALTKIRAAIAKATGEQQ